MIGREFLAIAAANLWRMKLRTTLTAVGVMVGVGALVSMLSFGFGLQKNMLAEFRRIGLFRTIQVLPGKEQAARSGSRGLRKGVSAGDADSDSAGHVPDATGRPRALDAAALDQLAAIPGVGLAYPQQSFEARVTLGDSTRTSVIQALPAGFIRRRPFGKMDTGRFFAADSAREAVVSRAWLKRIGLPADSVLGRRLRIETAGSAQVITAVGGRLLERYGVPRRLVRRAGDFVGRILERLRPTRLEVTVVGVADIQWGFGFRLGEVLLPSGLAAKLDYLSFGDPMELLALASGSGGLGWPMIVVTLENERDYGRVKGEIERLGFATLSFPEQLERMRKDFLLFDAFVVLLGLVALFVAAIGIANTLIMSIFERTREIGILKALGAEDGHVRALFLTEAAVIGLIGSIAGLGLGLGVSRVASAIARVWMVKKEIPQMDPFYLPPWVGLAAIAFGTLISVLAGLYPASRAARIDPVRALRYD
jgi:putative ABC transport system permease protein